MRYFEKISFDQFKKDVSDNIELYESYNLPVRKTKTAGCYDFEVIEGFTLKPGEIIKIPTGIKAKYNDDEVLFICVRSGVGFKHNVRMTNQVGIIDSDYYNNSSNEGHMWLSVQNHGDKDYVVSKGDAVCQCMFIKYLTVDNEEEILNERNGGFGSTGKEGNYE